MKLVKLVMILFAAALSNVAHAALVTEDWLVDVDVRYGTYWLNTSYEVLDFTAINEAFHLELYVSEEQSYWQRYSIDWDGSQATVNTIASDSYHYYSVGEQNTPLILSNTSNELQLKAWGHADHYITLTAPSPSSVPIPAAIWLFGSGLIGLIGFARKK